MIYPTISDLTKDSFNSGGAYVGEDLADIRLGNRYQTVQNGRLNTTFLSDLLAVDDSETLIKLLIAHIKCREEIFDEGEIIIFVGIPSIRGLL